MSYSAVDRQRFIRWLKKKYGTVGELNNAWAAQRWSRRLNSVEDVHLPLTDGPGPSERYLHLHHYWSDVTVARLEELDAIRQRYAPELPSISNPWDTASRRGFDDLSTYKSYVSFGADKFLAVVHNVDDHIPRTLVERCMPQVGMTAVSVPGDGLGSLSAGGGAGAAWGDVGRSDPSGRQADVPEQAGRFGKA